MTTATAEQPETEAHDEPTPHLSDKPSYEDINVPVIILVGVISTIVTFLSIAFVQGMCYHWQSSKIKDRSTEVVSMPAAAQIVEQKAVLNGGDGTISIDEAMKKVIEEYGKK